MDGRDVVAMSRFGLPQWGRFANQIFQYHFLRLYANKNDLSIETSSWIGQYLFGHNDSPITKQRPSIDDGFNYDGYTAPIISAAIPQVNVDIKGYFQYHTSFYAPGKTFFRSLFRPVGEAQEVVEKSISGLKSRGKTIVGFHLRRGDYGTFEYPGSKCFFRTPCSWCLNWLEEHWSGLDNPVLFLASDEMDMVKSDFAKFNPVTNEDMEVQLPKAPFYPDFYTLSQCDVLCISNSSFSFAASMLNERCEKFYRSRLSEEGFILYDPWNSHTIFRDEFYTHDPLPDTLKGKKVL